MQISEAEITKESTEKMARSKKQIVKQCPQCGKEFVKTGNRQTFCSRECGTKYRYRKKRNYNRSGQELIKCECCGRLTEKRGPNQQYCPECSDYMKYAAQRNTQENRRAQRSAKNSMKDITTGVLDERMEECRERGISYSQLQQEKTWEKIYKGEL